MLFAKRVFCDIQTLHIKNHVQVLKSYMMCYVYTNIQLTLVKWGQKDTKCLFVRVGRRSQTVTWTLTINNMNVLAARTLTEAQLKISAYREDARRLQAERDSLTTGQDRWPHHQHTPLSTSKWRQNYTVMTVCILDMVVFFIKHPKTDKNVHLHLLWDSQSREEHAGQTLGCFDSW